jgi:uncharacterized protein YaiE (UPF0345 family)
LSVNESEARLLRFHRGGCQATRRALHCGPMSTSSLKHNSYFDGQVQSIGYERHGRRATVGVIAPGEYHFGTDAAERMTVISGEIAAKPDGGVWSQYAAGTAFEIAAHSGFDVRVGQPSAYLCEFLS